MAINLPDNPTVGDIYTDPTTGYTYEWDGVVWQSYTSSATKSIRILDDISGSFNGSTNIFPITISGSAFTPASAQSLRISLGGIIQTPSVDYSISSSNIVFTTAPSPPLSFSGISYGPAIPLSVVSDGSVTPAKLSSGGPSWNNSGDLNISGVTTASSFYSSGEKLISGVGISSEGLYVGSGATTIDFRGSGISTVTVSAGIATVNVVGAADMPRVAFGYDILFGL